LASGDILPLELVAFRYFSNISFQGFEFVNAQWRRCCFDPHPDSTVISRLAANFHSGKENFFVKLNPRSSTLQMVGSAENVMKNTV
jgi:hypothetical protein